MTTKLRTAEEVARSLWYTTRSALPDSIRDRDSEIARAALAACKCGGRGEVFYTTVVHQEGITRNCNICSWLRAFFTANGIPIDKEPSDAKLG